MNDLISRSALREAVLKRDPEPFKYEIDFQSGLENMLENVLEDIEAAPAVDAEPVRHDGCALCEIKETGHGIIASYAVGWQMCIKKRDGGYYMVINHKGSQIDFLVGCCPMCGRKLN